MCEGPRLLPGGGTPGQEEGAAGHLRLVQGDRQEDPPADERVRLWDVHLQVCRV